jgi:hypothetical protein
MITTAVFLSIAFLMLITMPQEPQGKTPAQRQIEVASVMREQRIARVYRRMERLEENRKHQQLRHALRNSVHSMQASSLRLEQCLQRYSA